MVFCTECMKEVDYDVEEKESIEEVRDEHINAKLQITKCKECGSEIFIPEVEEKNCEILYSKYNDIKGYEAIKFRKYRKITFNDVKQRHDNRLSGDL